jgi:hypothetical protein
VEMSSSSIGSEDPLQQWTNPRQKKTPKPLKK